VLYFPVLATTTYRQSITTTQTDLVKIRQAYAEATASKRRMERNWQQVEAVANDWYTRAQLALRNGNEGLAREALARRQQYVDQAESLKTQMDTQTVATDKLYDAMRTLEAKIQEAVAKKEQLIARARTAKSLQQINDMLSGLTGKTSMDAFNRMEQKVESLEAAAEVSAEMGLLKFNDSVESEFRVLEQSSEVDFELEKMKSEMKQLGAARDAIPVGPVAAPRQRISVTARRGRTIDIL
jgi:phage shock protein A